MIRSMTAFGRSVLPAGGKKYTVEIKSVNGKFLDCTVKYPRQYGFIEEKIKNHIASRGIMRGKLECYLGVEVLERQGVTITLDNALAKSYIDALRRLRDEFDLHDDISVSLAASYHDIFTMTQPDEDPEAEWETVRSVLDCALDEFILMREREGARLAADAENKLAAIEKLAAEIGEISKKNTVMYPQKLADRIKLLLEAFDIEAAEQRILTEAAIFADKSAIDEELVRLSSHLTAFRQIMAEEESVGRKLDFLLQEINREANTIGSKSQDTEIAHLVVELKSTIEKIREQIQNLE